MQQITKHHDLIYDLGMHRGEDTEYYLKKGFRVLAFEANPDLVALNQKKFSGALADGRLNIISGAIVTEEHTGGTVRFYRNPLMSVWGTVDRDFAERSASAGYRMEEIDVPAVDFQRVLIRHGVPRYMKIDLEGVDLVCLRALKHVTPKPDFLSMESEKKEASGLLEEIKLLHHLGYQRFQAVQQFGMAWRKEPEDTREGKYAGHAFPEGSSGLFGSDLPGKWLSMDALLEEYRNIFRQYRRWGDGSLLDRYAITRNLLYAFSRLTRRPLPGWYDTHACLHPDPSKC
jgi:FkbM family methyltransferase